MQNQTNLNNESEVTELLRTHIRFVGNTAIHVFDVLVGKEQCRLMFNATDLTWHIAAD